jgi:hypothetical protein
MTGNKWSWEQALAIYNLKVKPKTHTLYGDALQEIDSGDYENYNLFMLEYYMYKQTFQDLYTALVKHEGTDRFPTIKDFVEWEFNNTLRQSREAALEGINGRLSFEKPDGDVPREEPHMEDLGMIVEHCLIIPIDETSKVHFGSGKRHSFDRSFAIEPGTLPEKIATYVQEAVRRAKEKGRE